VLYTKLKSPFSLLSLHWEHFSLSTLIGMLKNSDICVWHIKERIKQSYWRAYVLSILFFHGSYLKASQVDEQKRWGGKRTERELIDSTVASLSEGQAETMRWLLAETPRYCSAPRNKCPFCACFFSLSPKKAVTMKPSLKQQFVSQEPGKVDCNGGGGGRLKEIGSWNCHHLFQGLCSTEGETSALYCPSQDR